MQLVSSAENSSLDWRAQYAYIEDIHDDRGFTAGIIGFTSGTGDMLSVIEKYTILSPGNDLARFIPRLKEVDGSKSTKGLKKLPKAWKKAAGDEMFRRAQDEIRDEMYFVPAVSYAKQDGLSILGQFIYYDAIVMHGPGEDDDEDCFESIRKAAMKKARTPVKGGDERAYLELFLDQRKVVMEREEAHCDTSRVDTCQRVFLERGNWGLDGPLQWHVYKERFKV